jgi:hypothetical protein
MRSSTPQFQRLGNFYVILNFEARQGPFVSVSSLPEQLEAYLLLDSVATFRGLPERDKAHLPILLHPRNRPGFRERTSILGE